MRITPGMVEAGATRWASARDLDPNAMVAAIYQAMEERRHIEEMQARNPNAEKPVYKHQSWPAMRYGPGGQKKICNGPEDVPEGWANRPDDVDDGMRHPADEPRPSLDLPRRRGRPPKERAEAA